MEEIDIESRTISEQPIYTNKILPIGEFSYKDDEIGVDEVRVKYLNNGDCVNDEVQSLRVFTQNNGVARFIVLETERWAISDIDELILVLEDFKKRAGLK